MRIEPAQGKAQIAVKSRYARDAYTGACNPFGREPGGVGAAFDFHAGLVSQAPAWMQRSGLEWSYRLSREPRRLWRRYARYNPLFVAGFARQYVRYRRER